MLVPASPVELLGEVQDDFPRHDWLNTFATYKWTYVAGYAELVTIAAAKLPSYTTVSAALNDIKGYIIPGRDQVPDTWKNAAPSDGWGTCKDGQVTEAAAAQAMRVDKGAICIFALQAFLDARHIDLSVFPIVEFRPAIYTIRGFDRRALMQLRERKPGPAFANFESVYEAMTHTFAYTDERTDPNQAQQKAKVFLEHVGEGYGMTFQHARDIMQFLDSNGAAASLKLDAFRNRNDDGRMAGKKGPNRYETVILDPRKFAQLSKTAFRVQRLAPLPRPQT